MGRQASSKVVCLRMLKSLIFVRRWVCCNSFGRHGARVLMYEHWAARRLWTRRRLRWARAGARYLDNTRNRRRTCCSTGGCSHLKRICRAGGWPRGAARRHRARTGRLRVHGGWYCSSERVDHAIRIEPTAVGAYGGQQIHHLVRGAGSVRVGEGARRHAQRSARGYRRLKARCVHGCSRSYQTILRHGKR